MTIFYNMNNIQQVPKKKFNMDNVMKKISYNNFDMKEYKEFISNITSCNKEFIFKFINDYPFICNFLRDAVYLNDDDNNLVIKFLKGGQIYYDDHNCPDDDGNPLDVYNESIYWFYAQNLAFNIFKDGYNDELVEELLKIFLEEMFSLEKYGLTSTSNDYYDDIACDYYYIKPNMILVSYLFNEIITNNEYLERIDDVTIKLCKKKLMQNRLNNSK